jgi:hypothetical protein
LVYSSQLELKASPGKKIGGEVVTVVFHLAS